MTSVHAEAAVCREAVRLGIQNTWVLLPVLPVGSSWASPFLSLCLSSSICKIVTMIVTFWVKKKLF